MKKCGRFYWGCMRVKFYFWLSYCVFKDWVKWWIVVLVCNVFKEENKC